MIAGIGLSSGQESVDATLSSGGSTEVDPWRMTDDDHPSSIGLRSLKFDENCALERRRFSRRVIKFHET
jgi:hypothetical protein